MKRLLSALGGFGIVLYYILMLFICTLPFIMIDLNFWLTTLLIFIEMCLPITSIIFWIWGLVCTIGGPQDIFAIIYYIVFAVMWLPFFISTIIDLFKPNR